MCVCVCVYVCVCGVCVCVCVCDPLCEIQAVSKSNYEITSIKIWFLPLISL